MDSRLTAYLAIEAEMIRLDDAGDALADDVRDLLDKIWYGLSDAEHEALSKRKPEREAGRRADAHLGAHQMSDLHTIVER